MNRPAPRVIGVPQLLGMALRVQFWLFVLLVPVLGFWVSSSLAATLNISVRLCVVAGVLLCPLLPLLWEVIATTRRKPGPRVLHLSDRLVLRTLAINVPFLVGLLTATPERTFVALTTRGDWFLDGRHDEHAEALRRWSFAAAASLEGLYRIAHENPYREPVERRRSAHPRPKRKAAVPDLLAPGAAPNASAAGEARPDGGADLGGTAVAPAGEATIDVPEEDDDGDDEPVGEELDPLPPGVAAGGPGAAPWPLPATLHPAALAIPQEAERSVRTIGRYFRQAVPDPVQRIRALHDFVADRIAYDTEALYRTGVRYQDNLPAVVLRRRKAVCMGYALLLRALGRAAGVDIRYVSGDVRDREGKVSGSEGHAWNAAIIGRQIVLLDPTWDAGYVSDQAFQKEYKTDYLLTPPEAFGMNHFPEERRWQGRAQPISRGEFLRQPVLNPRFFAHQLRLREPSRSQVSVDEEVQLLIDNPAAQFVMAEFLPIDREAPQAPPRLVDGQGEGRCTSQGGDPVQLLCRLPTKGRYRIDLLASTRRNGSYTGVGSLYANRVR